MPESGSEEIGLQLPLKGIQCVRMPNVVRESVPCVWYLILKGTLSKTCSCPLGAQQPPWARSEGSRRLVCNQRGREVLRESAFEKTEGYDRQFVLHPLFYRQPMELVQERGSVFSAVFHENNSCCLILYSLEALQLCACSSCQQGIAIVNPW